MNSLFLLCSLAGVMLVAGSLYLLWKGVIDLRGGHGVSEMVMPGGSSIKLPVPALVMFVLGVFMVVFPVYKSPELCPDLPFHKKTALEMVELHGKVSADTEIEVYAAVDEWQASATDSFVLSVPYVQNRNYIIRYTDKLGNELSQETVLIRPGEAKQELRGVQLVRSAPAEQPPALKLEQTEASATVAEFK